MCPRRATFPRQPFEYPEDQQHRTAETQHRHGHTTVCEAEDKALFLYDLEVCFSISRSSPITENAPKLTSSLVRRIGLQDESAPMSVRPYQLHGCSLLEMH